MASVTSIQFLLCHESDLFSYLVTFAKKLKNKKIVFVNSDKVASFFVDALDCFKCEATTDYAEFASGKFETCILSREDEEKVVNTEVESVIMFDIPSDNTMEAVRSGQLQCRSIYFLAREVEAEWLKTALPSEAKPLAVTKKARADIEPLRKRARKMFATQRDAQLAYKSFMRDYKSLGRCSVWQLNPRLTVANFGLDIAPRVPEIEKPCPRHGAEQAPAATQKQKRPAVSSQPQLPTKAKLLRIK